MTIDSTNHSIICSQCKSQDSYEQGSSSTCIANVDARWESQLLLKIAARLACTQFVFRTDVPTMSSARKIVERYSENTPRNGHCYRLRSLLSLTDEASHDAQTFGVTRCRLSEVHPFVRAYLGVAAQRRSLDPSIRSKASTRTKNGFRS